MHAEPADFSHLTPETVIDAVETALGVRCTNVCRPLNSYINRVYEVGLDAGGFAIVKFYRPGRWDEVALRDELDFLADLAAAEVPVVPPLTGADGQALHTFGGTRFAVFPKRGGRPLDEPTDEVWRQLGRLLGRLHVVGAQRRPRGRVRWHPEAVTREHLAYILASRTLPSSQAGAYERAVEELVDLIAPAFEDIEEIRLHGDCHRANILYRPGEGFHLLDFDDMSTGPAVQDLWMLLPDKLPAARRELDLLLDGYELFREFPYATLRLIEPLRAMRFIHYTAWCARQISDGGFTRLVPDWGTNAFWNRELADLDRQRQEILDAGG